MKFLRTNTPSIYSGPEDKMDLSFFKNKKITVMGLGLHGGGLGVAQFFASLGAKVLVTDLKSKEELAPSIKKLEGYNIEYVLGEHRAEDFKNTDLVIKNPAVPSNSKYLQIAQQSNVLVDTDMGVFFEFCKSPIIGVTGTKGKSTVATLIHAFLTKKYPHVVLAGNIRTSVLAKLKEIKKNTLVVLELSSWQLEGLKPHKVSPHIAVITNIMADHMDRYHNLDDYIEDKSVIFKYQARTDYLILNYDNKITRSLGSKAKSQIYFYSLRKFKKPYNSKVGSFLDKKTIYFGEKGREIGSITETKILGKHGLSNLLAALTVALLYEVPLVKIKKTIQEFKGLPYRLQPVGEISGVLFYNDTCATMPDATIAALSSLEEPIVLIAGGAEKKLSFKKLATKIAKKVKALILLEGKATPRFKKSVKTALLKEKRSIPIQETNEMKKAVELAFKLAKKGEAVLLSPACSSFGLFKHEFDRGEQFNKAVKSLRKTHQDG